VSTRRDDLANSGKLRPLKLGIAASHTIDFVSEALPATCLRHGLLIDIHQVDYGQGAQQLLDGQSALAAWNPDFILLSFDRAAPNPASPRLDAPEAKGAVSSPLEYVASLRDAAHANTGSGLILQTLPAPPESLFGNYDRRVPGSIISM